MTDHTRTEKIGGDSIYFCGHSCRARNRYDKMVFLGHVIFGNVIFVDPRKVKAILNWECPKNVTEI